MSAIISKVHRVVDVNWNARYVVGLFLNGLLHSVYLQLTFPNLGKLQLILTQILIIC